MNNSSGILAQIEKFYDKFEYKGLTTDVFISAINSICYRKLKILKIINNITFASYFNGHDLYLGIFEKFNSTKENIKLIHFYCLIEEDKEKQIDLIINLY